MTNHDELCEKVFPTTNEIVGIVWMKERFKEALTSGLLCDGKQLEEVKKEHTRVLDIVLWLEGLRVKYEKEIESLKLKLDEAKKDAEWFCAKAGHNQEISSLKIKLSAMDKLELEKQELIRIADCLQKKLSGSCEKSIICQDCGGSGSLGRAKDGRLISCESCGGHKDTMNVLVLARAINRRRNYDREG